MNIAGNIFSPNSNFIVASIEHYGNFNASGKVSP
jgi:hypothetical protein